MKILKCPKCGGCVPEGNEVCNHCGHRMFIFGGTGLYVGSSKNANKLDTKDNPFISKNNNKTGLVLFIMFLFVLPIIIQIYDLYKEFEYQSDENNYYEDSFDNQEYYTCSDLCTGEYIESNNHCLCKNGNIYDENNNIEHYSTGISSVDNRAKCRVYCNDISASYVTDKCVCSNGKYYDIEGNEIDGFESNISDRTVSQWYDDVTSGKTVVSVICDVGIRDCITYSTITTMSSFENDYILHFFNINYLNDSDKNILLNTYSLPGYSSNNNKPYTFIVKDGSVKANISGMMYQTAYEKFLMENEVISN